MEAETPGAPDAAAVPDALVVVQQALESMLSKKHLVKDPGLAGSMNPQMYIPVRTLLSHERMLAVGANEELLVAAATRSTRLGIDDSKTMVRPLLKAKRNVIILRDLPPGTTEEEIRSIFFDSPYADAIREAKPEVNNTWFVKFQLDDVQEVVLWLSSQKFKGEPVKAAMKSEHFLRSFYPATGPAPPMPQPDFQYHAPDAMQQNAIVPGYGGPSWQPPEFSGPSWADVPNPSMTFQPMAPETIIAPLEYGLQPPGFWQPWGARLQPAPLIFISQTALTPASVAALAEQAGDSITDAFESLAQPDRGKSTGGGKGASGWDNGGGWERGGGWEKSSGWKNDSSWQKSSWDNSSWNDSNWDAPSWNSKGQSKSNKGGGKSNW